MQTDMPCFLFIFPVPLNLPPNCQFSAFYKLVVNTALFQQLFIGAALNDLSVVDHKDFIRMTDGFQPVGDHQNSHFFFCNFFLLGTIVFRLNFRQIVTNKGQETDKQQPIHFPLNRDFFRQVYFRPYL